MNKTQLLLIWSVICVPLILSVLMNFGYKPDSGVQPIFLWAQLIFVLSGIFTIKQIPVNKPGLKVLAVGLYIVLILFFWLAIGITIGCNNGGGCFAH